MPFRPDARLGFLTVIAALGVACFDQSLAPNTDVGLAVWTNVTPGQLRASDSARFITYTIHIRNPSRREIRVVSGGPPYRFTNDPAQGQGVFASLRVASDTSALNAGRRIDWGWDSVYTFAPRETRFEVDSIRLSDLRGSSPNRVGTYVVRGWFNGREGASSSFSVVP